MTPSRWSRQDESLRRLLLTRRTAALATLDDSGQPYASLTPFACLPRPARLVIQVSLLAVHTRYLATRPAVSLLVADTEPADDSVHEVPRVTLLGTATVLTPDHADHAEARQAYLQRFPAAALMDSLGDFRYTVIALSEARQVAGFGAARRLARDRLDVLWPC